MRNVTKVHLKKHLIHTAVEIPLCTNMQDSHVGVTVQEQSLPTLIFAFTGVINYLSR